MIYLDNSATSWPKPSPVVDAISHFVANCGGSPGRAGHRHAQKAAREVFDAREMIAKFFNLKLSERVIFTSNSTHAINIALKGILKKGDHVITTLFEHNSMLRPLRYLESIGLIDISFIGTNSLGEFDLSALSNSIRPNTKLIASIHASNVTGDVMPIKQIGSICKENNILFLVDASQSAGEIPIDIQTDNIDLLAFTGHKKLYGPTGIGGLCVACDEPSIQPLIQGGTGSRSDKEYHPDFYPDKLEAGTLNTVGIVGLKAGLQFIADKGVEVIHTEQKALTNRFIDGLNTIPQIEIHRGFKSLEQVGVVSMNVKNMIPSDLAYKLDSDFGIMVRSGLHCAPLMHKALGTFPQGSVRFSFGCFNTISDVEETLSALKRICGDIKEF